LRHSFDVSGRYTRRKYSVNATGASGTLLRTTDGGVHWSTEPNGTTHALERLFFTDQNHGWAAGFGGTILAFDQGGAPRLRS
jgi:photosystem II stability/assembly factor-like uncharacterized protein